MIGNYKVITTTEVCNKIEELTEENTKLRLEIDNLKVENQSLRGAANSLKMHYEKAQANIERLKKYDEERDIRLHARLIANTKSETAKEVLKDLKKFMHNKFKDLDEYEFEYITERDIDSFLKTVDESNF